MVENDFNDVVVKLKKRNQILFDRNSTSLQVLLKLIRLQNHRTLVLWAFKFIEEIQESVEPLFPNDKRIKSAIYLCKEWASGREKMPKAKRALLDVHAMAKEIQDPITIAKLHAIGQGLATIHVETHAIGLAVYELTSIVLEKGANYFQEPINSRIQQYIDVLKQCSVEAEETNLIWASFLLNDDKPNKEELLYQKNHKGNNILLHIPHANVHFPDDMGEMLVDNETLMAFSNQISDVRIDKLFSHGIGEKYVASYSRVYCDLEKFIDDSQEVMSKYGQGVFYTKDSKGNEIRRLTNEYKERVAREYYFPYHKGLDELTLSMLDRRLIIVDCHSYLEECVLHNKSESYADIDLGFDEQYCSRELLDGVRTIFANNGYSVSYNHPYEGTLIPNAIYRKNVPKVFCLMIEINKRVYLPSQKLFDKCKATIKAVLEYIKDFK